VADECVDAVVFDPLGKRLVAKPSSLTRIFVEPGVRTDGEKRERTVGVARCDVKREAAAHRVTHDMTSLEAELVPQPQNVRGTPVHRAWGARADLRLAVAAKVWHDPSPALRHMRDDLVPAAAALGEAVQERHRRAGARHYVAQPDVLSRQNHRQSML